MTTMAPAIPAEKTPTGDERLGAHLRELRKARGLTLTQLAEAATLSHPFLSQLERGLARPSMASLERLARALGTSRVELIAASEPPRPDQTVVTAFFGQMPLIRTPVIAARGAATKIVVQ